MADAPNNLPDDGPDGRMPEDEPLFGVEGDAEDAPRRAASAQFVVKSEVGSDAMLREAMDPANQSLAEALRLSYRVLQVVILVLVVLFVFSGFQTVEEGQTGVLLRWGKILEVSGSKALDDGLKFSWWPYPAGEFVLFNDRDRKVGLGNMYWPDMKDKTFAQAVDAATVHGQLRPGSDGSVLTSGGDIAHLRLDARYRIDAPERFVLSVENENADPARLDADKLVELSLQRAVVHRAATRTLAEFIDFSEPSKVELMTAAQRQLDEVNAGIVITMLESPVDPTPALAIKRAYGAVQEAKVQADELVLNARQEAHKTLLAAAGGSYPDLVALIGEYETAFARGGDDRSAALLAQINDRLADERTSGEVATILGQARAYRSTIERTLGYETTRFLSHLDAYREHPHFEIGRLWLESYGRVLSRNDTEIIYAPPDGREISVALVGAQHIRDTRRKQRLQADEQATWLEFGRSRGTYIPRAGEMRDGPGRQLDPTGRGALNP